jgi:hypothetical protein
MRRSYKDEYNHSRREALEMAKRYGTSSGIELCLSFTKYGKKVFENMNRKLYEDAELDRQLGVISEEEYKLEIDTYLIIENSIGEACVY